MNAQKILRFGIGPIATAGLGMVTIPLISWLFTPEDVGRLYMIQIVVSFSVLLLSLGLDQAYVREFHESADHAALLKISVAPGALLFSILAVPSVLFAERLSHWLFDASDPVYFWITLACAIVAFYSRFLSLILRMQERGLAFSMSQVIPKALFVLIIGGLALADIPKDFIQLQLAFFASTLAVLVVFVWNTRTQWVPALRASIDVQRLRFLLSYSLPLVFAGLAYWGLSATSAIALRSLSSLHEVGIYSVAMSAAGVAVIFQSVFSVIWAPVVYKWVANGADMSRVDRVARHASAMVCGIFVMVGIFSWLIDYVLPSQYDGVKYLVLGSIAQPLLYTLSEVTGVGIGIMRRTMLSLWSTLFALLVNLGLNLLLVPELGASGAVTANALAFFVFFLARTEASAFVWRPLPRRRLYLVMAGAVSLAVLTVLLGPSLGNLIWVPWTVVMPLALWVFRAEGADGLRIFQEARLRRKGMLQK